VLLQTQRKGLAAAWTFEAWCFATDLVGHAVYVFAPKLGSRFQVTKANIDDSTKVPAIGIIIAKSGPSVCTVQYDGQVLGVYTGLTEGESLFVGTNALLTNTPPARPLVGKRWIQPFAYVLASDTILLQRSWPYKKVAGAV